MTDHEWAILTAYPVTLSEAIEYERSGDWVTNLPDGLFQRQPEYGHVGCIRCSRSYSEVIESPCLADVEEAGAA